jgi:glycerol-3-phosphate dehydrogenase
MSEPPSEIFDLLIVGGGINGAGIARDAAGRGLSVLLVEQDDLAAHTSSASTKLIHGGLRYLEFYEFSLVRKALAEREVLFGIAPHIMYPLRFVMPHDASLRPAWMIRAGLFLYDHLARRRTLQSSRGIDLRTHPAGTPLRDTYRRGFEYADGWVDDARLVVLNALDAHERGARIRTRTRCERLQPLPTETGEMLWSAALRRTTGEDELVRARAVVNATGPWAAALHDAAVPGKSKHGLRLIKGSHIVVPRLFEHDYAYILQASDRRIVFAIPYEGQFTLIGTTDVEYHGDPHAPQIDRNEIAYLCAEASRYFRKPVHTDDVVWTYSGVRPLLEDESADARAVTRDYALELQQTPAPLLSVFGGKITTYRVLAEEVMDRLAPLLGCTHTAWSGNAPLPGGDLAPSFEDFLHTLMRRYPQHRRALLERWARAYGSRVTQLLDESDSGNVLGREVAPDLYEAELRYLVAREWAVTADDVLWRRSKLGLRLHADAVRAVDEWLSVYAESIRGRSCGRS